MLCDEKRCKMPEFQACLNDLPHSDFNVIFKSIPSFYQNFKAKDGANCFVSGIPGFLKVSANPFRGNSGGHMLLTFIGRCIPDPYGNDSAHLDLASKSLIELVQEV
ncbi:hypothetical protein FXO38_17090 [Capsicum annuum]|nr:hypothetical protein FXO38_17090 [Capsicum annuum]